MKHVHIILLMFMIFAVIIGLCNSCIVEGMSSCSTSDFKLISVYNNKNQNVPVETANVIYMSKLPTKSSSEQIGKIIFTKNIKNVTSTSPLFRVERNDNSNEITIHRTDHKDQKKHEGISVRDLILDVTYTDTTSCKVEITVKLLDVESDCKQGCRTDMNVPSLIYKSDTLGVNNDGKLEYKHFYRAGCKYVENPDLLMDKSVEERSKYCSSHNDCYTCGTYETKGILTKEQLIQQYSENKEKQSEMNKLQTCVDNKVKGGMNSMNAMRTCLNMENEIKEIEGSSISGGLSSVVGLDSNDIDAKGYENESNSRLGDADIGKMSGEIEKRVSIEKKETDDKYKEMLEKHVKEMHGMELDNVDMGVVGYERGMKI
jgi:hypothetical protein